MQLFFKYDPTYLFIYLSLIHNPWNLGLKEKSAKEGSKNDKKSLICEWTTEILFVALHPNYKTKIRMTKVRKM